MKTGRSRRPAQLRPGDRIVFIGDSITEQRQYTNYVESYLVLRYPGLNLSFLNAGWGGDTAKGGLSRLARDVIAVKPTVVVVCFGMNDGGYGYAGVQAAADAYRKHLEGILDRLAAKKIRVVLMTPGIVDDSVPALKWLKDRTDYNRKELRTIAGTALALGAKRKLPVADIHALMTASLAAAARAGVDMGPDGIHPDAGGSLLMAHGLLAALGVPPRRETITVGARRESVITVDPLPYAVEAPARKMLPFVPFQQTWNGIRLAVKGLRTPEAALSIDGRLTPVLPGAALKAGLDVGDMWGIATLAEAERANTITREKANMYRQFWRALALPDTWQVDAPYDPVPHRVALRAVAELERWRRTTLRPKRMRVLVRPVKPGPAVIAAGGTIPRWRVESGFAPAPVPEWPRVDLAGIPADRVASVYATGLGLPLRALAIVDSGAAQPAVLTLDVPGPAAVQLNDRPMAGGKEDAGNASGRTFALPLVAGENRIVVELQPDQNGFRGFGARLTTLAEPVRNRW